MADDQLLGLHCESELKNPAYRGNVNRSQLKKKVYGLTSAAIVVVTILCNVLLSGNIAKYITEFYNISSEKFILRNLK